MAMQLSGSLNLTGSLNVSSSVNLSGSVVINKLTYPTFGFADGQHGVEVPTLGVNNVFSMQVPKTVYEYVKNDSGVTLLKGTPVHSTGTVGFNTLVIAASASNASTMPATFILAQDLDNEEEGLGIAIGAIQGVNTTGLIAGDAVYVGANGGWVQTKPTGSNLIQNLGIVTKVGDNGGGVVLGAGRSNDVPNIQQGYFWVGNDSSVATATPTSSFELSGRGVVSSSQQITNYYKFAETASANTTFYGNVTASGNLQANQLYIGGATTSTGLIGASEAVVQNELGIQFGDATGTYMRVIANGANSNTAIVAGAFSGAEPPLDLIVGGNTQMRLRADGNNGINTTTPVFTGLTGSLTIRKSYNNDIASVPTTTGQNYYSNQSGLYLFGRNSGITIVGGNSEEATICYGNQSTHRFASISAGTGTDAVGGDLYIKVGSDTERLRIGSTGDGNVTVSTGNLVIGTSGKGIDFSATSNGSGTTTSELLNDYEEGTWTPTMSTNVSGTITIDSGTSVAYYTKIGRQVTVNGSFYVTSVSSPVGEWRIGGLPFTSKAVSGLRSGLSVFADGLETTATTSVVGYIDQNVTYATLYKYSAGVVATIGADVKAGSYVFFTGTYFV